LPALCVLCVLSTPHTGMSPTGCLLGIYLGVQGCNSCLPLPTSLRLQVQARPGSAPEGDSSAGAAGAKRGSSQVGQHTRAPPPSPQF
jgi:hypothetical protein